MSEILAKPMLIEGQWVGADSTFVTTNPATGQPNFEIGAADDAQVDAAVLRVLAAKERLR